MAKSKQTVSALTKQVKALQQQVNQLRSTEASEQAMAPERPEDMVAREVRRGEPMDYLTVRPGNADYSTPFLDQLARLQGRSNLQPERKGKRRG